MPPHWFPESVREWAHQNTSSPNTVFVSDQIYEAGANSAELASVTINWWGAVMVYFEMYPSRYCLAEFVLYSGVT
eukprot:15248433-Ditylum_brightwellii.AAC.1